MPGSLPTPRRSWVEQIMGLPVSVLARGDLRGSDEAVDAVYVELRRIDAVFSPYRDDSQVSQIARGELRLQDSDAEVQDVAARCAAWSERTGGVFDATTPEGLWDPSGLVKGWAVERAARLLPVTTDWCLNAGGDVVVRSASGDPFRIGIQDPQDRDRVAAVVSVLGGGVATSGTAARGAHLYDPRTGAPARSALGSLSVMGPSLEDADVLATACFVEGSFALLPSGYEGLSIAADGTVRTTAGWPHA